MKRFSPPILLLLVISSVDSSSDDAISYVVPVNDTTDLVSIDAKPFFMPPGCLCKKSGIINDKQCDQFDCVCKCDVTAGVCDLNCCCDEECGGHSFVECLDEGDISPTVKMCTERASALEDINLRYPLRVSDSPEVSLLIVLFSKDQLHGLICIESDNSPVKGVFFADPGYPRAREVFSPGSRIAKPIGFHSYAYNLGKSYGTYQLGDKIPTYNFSNQQFVLTIGYLALPSAGDDGSCIDSNAALFGKSESNTCSRSIKDLAIECESKFSINRYVSDLFVENEKGSMALGAQETRVRNGAIPLRNSNKPSSTWDESSSSCTDALKSLTYIVTHNQTTILGVSVEAETTDVGLETNELKQHFAIEFIHTEAKPSDRSHDKNNIITRPRSGNPGYSSGKPTMGAIGPDDATLSYLIAQRAGFTVMDTGAGGQCNSSSPTGSVVGFAKDIYVGCTHSMTSQELREFCTSDHHPMMSERKIGDSFFVFPKWLESKQDFLGIFGNADPLDKQQWVKIESSSDEPTFRVKSRRWLSVENRCVGMPSKLRIDILWTHVGNVMNPQAKILSAKKTYDESSSLQHVLPPNEKQPYAFTTTVSWTYLHPKSDIVKSPPPTLIFSVPHDVFYPFQSQLSSGTIRSLVKWRNFLRAVTVLFFTQLVA
ncbi:hypothetical protein HJC23_003778 [Cyclotella cryptica]|uniref:Tectonic domain-containing protein n=1 Tax=Cyclotella cryptica TaxID=29204 RepID=A0ABD3QTP0_9STRA